jgi:replicative DNA helicase
VAVLAETPVPTPTGWVPAFRLSTKDVVFDDLGRPQKVAGVQLYIPGECYEATFHDGLSLVGDRHMSFMLQDRKWRDRHALWLKNRGKPGARKSMRRPLERLSAQELSGEGLAYDDGRRKYSLATCDPVQYPWVDLPVPPYVLGVYLSTLTPGGNNWLPRSSDAHKIQRRMRESGFFLSSKRRNGKLVVDFRPSLAACFSIHNQGAPSEVPLSYLGSSAEQRESLLEGFLDGYGHSGDRVGVFVGARSAARRLQGLAESLGYRTSLIQNSRDGRFKLNFVKNKQRAHFFYRFLSKVNKITPKQCAHVITERPFLVGEGFIAVC